MALYQLEDVGFSYVSKDRTQETLTHVSFEVNEGEFVAIVGPSGSGKSTILSLMEGFQKATSGMVLYQGQDLALFNAADLGEYRKHEIGMVFQFFNLVPDMSALDNVALAAMIAGVSREEANKKARDLLQELGLEEKAESRVSRLSGGQQQRVAIARALINEPKAILADEPTGNLDRASSEAVVELLAREQKQRGVSLVVVTHDREITERADNVIEL